MNLEKHYKDMLFGIAIFVGGMVALVIISRFLAKNETSVVSSQNKMKFIPTNNVVPVLTEIKEEIQMEKPVGTASNLSVDVSDRIRDVFKPSDGFPCSSIDITNNGPDSVYIGVNQWDWPEAPLPVGQSININFGQKDSIKRVYLKCDAGQSSNVSFYIIK